MMKKFLYYIPAIIFTLFYGASAISGTGPISPVVVIWLVLFWASGILLSRNKPILGWIIGHIACNPSDLYGNIRYRTNYQ